MNTNILSKTSYSLLFFLMIVFMYFISFNYIPFQSPGGIGLLLPSNTGVWISIISIIVLSINKIILTRTIRLSSITILLAICLTAMTLPGILSAKNVETREIILRAAQVIGFFFLFFSFTQYRLSNRKKNNLLYIIVLASLVQVIYALGQLYHNPEITPHFLLPYLGFNAPPVGAFLQVNIISISLVTAIIISIYLFIQPSFIKQDLYKKLLLVAVIMGGSFIIAIISSRAALIALSLALPLIIWGGWKQIKKKKKWSIAFLFSCFIGLSLGFSLANERYGLDKLGNKTTNSRTLAWKLSILSIKEKPLFGHGLGGFTKSYSDQNEKYTSTLDEKEYKSTSFFTHPHNEILYWWVESGIISVIAILVFVFYYLRLLFNHSKQYALQHLALLIPIGFHTQVSLPFYLSSLLMATFVFLLVLPIKNTLRNYKISTTPYFKYFSVICSILVFLSYTWFIKETISGTKTLAKIEKEGSKSYYLLADEINNPYWGDVALTHAHAISMGNELNEGNKNKALHHLEWIEKKIETHEDPSYYSLLLLGYKMFHYEEKYNSLIIRLNNRYPGRFVVHTDLANSE